MDNCIELKERINTIYQDKGRGNPILKDIIFETLPQDIKIMLEEIIDKPMAYRSEEDFRNKPIQYWNWYSNSLRYLENNKEVINHREPVVPNLDAKINQAINYLPKQMNIKTNVNIKPENFERIFNKQEIMTAFDSDWDEDANAIYNVTIDTKQMLFESEKHTIMAIMMQSDHLLNEAMENFLLKIIKITKEGIKACTAIDKKYAISIASGNYNLIDLLNNGMPLNQARELLRGTSRYVSPGCFEVTKETLTEKGLKELNLREKVQLMNCFWNCTNHFESSRIPGSNDKASFYEEGLKGSPTQLKLSLNPKSGPPLNMIYEKVAKHRDIIDVAYVGGGVDDYENLRSFLDRIEEFNTILLSNQANLWDIECKKGSNECRKLPDEHVIPSGKYPLCFDYNELKSEWKKIIDLIQVRSDQDIPPIVITEDFLKNIYGVIGTTKITNRYYTNRRDIELSSRERKYMNDYEKEMMKHNRYREAVDVELVKNGMENGGIFWTTGFSKFTLNLEGVIESNIKEVKEWFSKDGINEVMGKTAEKNGRYKYIKTGISGSTWKYLQLAFFCDFKELDKIYHIAIAYLVGCYHHSWYEVTKTTLDFFNDDIFKSLLIQKNYPQTIINDSFWKLNNNTKLIKAEGNPSLSTELKYIIRNIFFVKKEGIHSTTYLRFYMNYLLPLIGIGDRVVFKYDEKFRRYTTNRKADVKSSQIYFNCYAIYEQANATQEEKEKQLELRKYRERQKRNILGGSKEKRKTRRKKLKTVFPYLSRKNRSLMYG